jgi:hypothetical protein
MCAVRSRGTSVGLNFAPHYMESPSERMKVVMYVACVKGRHRMRAWTGFRGFTQSLQANTEIVP